MAKPVRRAESDDAKRLKDVERENATVERLLADAGLEKAAMKEVARGNSEPARRRRPSPSHPRDGVSERFASSRDTGDGDLPMKAAIVRTESPRADVIWRSPSTTACSTPITSPP